LPESRVAGGESTFAFAGDIDDGSPLDEVSAVDGAEGDMHCKIEGPERLAAFRRPPDDDEPIFWDDAFDDVAGRRVEFDVL